MTNPYRDVLVAFYTWQDPEKLSSVDLFLQTYKGAEHALVQELGQRSPLCCGWSDARLCLQWYLQKHRPDLVKDLDTIIQTWHAENSGAMRDEDALLPGGHFARMYADFDIRYTTDLFTQYLRLLELYDIYDGAQSHYLKSEIPKLLNQWHGKEREVVDAVQQKYEDFMMDIKAWVVRFYTKHKPDKLANVDDIIDSHKGVGASEILRVTLQRLYVPEKYFTSATWSTRHPKDWDIRFALIEYFFIRDKEKLLVVNEILRQYPPTDLVPQLYQEYEKDYLKVLLKKKVNPCDVLFPPWRNPDYGNMPTGIPAFTEKTPSAGAKQCDLLLLDEKEYPYPEDPAPRKEKDASERAKLQEKQAKRQQEEEQAKRLQEEQLRQQQEEQLKQQQEEQLRQQQEEQLRQQQEEQLRQQQEEQLRQQQEEQLRRQEEERDSCGEEEAAQRLAVVDDERRCWEAIHAEASESEEHHRHKARRDSVASKMSLLSSTGKLQSALGNWEPPEALKRTMSYSTVSSMLADDAFSVLSDHQVQSLTINSFTLH
eukprot:TRINITY_DN6939_c0_g1_i6.p1 TRINITY_DN6939_c0_g1~~TRINITY_DN6939_c0_g1_i6.p1  ORF type:complete len:540 (+),score=198.48 TRINITY_DN6939_c0_g1_i6:1575-3194(+)